MSIFGDIASTSCTLLS